jgi:hypothetical protein
MRRHVERTFMGRLQTVIIATLCLSVTGAWGALLFWGAAALLKR